jgi:hypothetical protein
MGRCWWVASPADNPTLPFLGYLCWKRKCAAQVAGDTTLAHEVQVVISQGWTLAVTLASC